jgi:hypothetical protein
LSGVGENYKWFSCNKVPADVLLKYVQKGISIILNSKERKAVSKYIMSNDRWGGVLNNLGIKPEKIYCCVTAGHPFFRPGIYGCGIRQSLRKFERDATGLYANTLVVTQPRQVFPYGEVVTNNLKQIYMPDFNVVTSILDYMESRENVYDNTIEVDLNFETTETDEDENEDDILNAD